MIAESVTAVVAGLKEAGIDFIASLPCKSFARLIFTIMDDPDFKHVAVGNEGDAIGICAGAWLGGKTPALVVENAGLVLATYQLMDTIYFFGGFPMLLVLDHRGDFGDGAGYWYFGNAAMTPRILENLGIPYRIVSESHRFAAELLRAQQTTRALGKPAAVLFSGEEVFYDSL